MLTLKHAKKLSRIRLASLKLKLPFCLEHARDNFFCCLLLIGRPYKRSSPSLMPRDVCEALKSVPIRIGREQTLWKRKKPTMLWT